MDNHETSSDGSAPLHQGAPSDSQIFSEIPPLLVAPAASNASSTASADLASIEAAKSEMKSAESAYSVVAKPAVSISSTGLPQGETSANETSFLPEAAFANSCLPEPDLSYAGDDLLQMRAALLYRERQMAAVRSISAKMLSGCSLDELLATTLGAARDVVGAEVGSLQLYDPPSDCLVFRHVLDTASLSMVGRGTPISTGINGQVFRSGHADITLKATERAEWNPEVDAQTGYRTQSLVTVPIKGIDDQPIGVVQLLNGGHLYGRRDIEVLEVLCAQVSQAIANAHLLQEAERRLEHLQALRSIDATIASSHDLNTTLSFFVEKVVSQLRIDAVSVSVLNPHILALEFAAGHGFRSQSASQTPSRLAQGPAGRAALERRIIFIPDMRQSAEMAHTSQWVYEDFVSYFAVPLIARGQVKGVIEAFSRRPLQQKTEWHSLVETLASQAVIAIDNAGLFSELQRSNMELAVAYDTTLEGWSRALDMRDRETEGHTRRVTDMALQLARKIKFPDKQLTHLRRGALLHDIGKMGIPDKILLKPSDLTEEEWCIMRRHPEHARDLLSQIPYLRPALDIPYCHHERWDGSGYPRGLKGEEIPLVARLFAIVDVYDALRSKRPYRDSWDEARVRQYIADNSGVSFDPSLVVAFLEMIVSHSVTPPYNSR